MSEYQYYEFQAIDRALNAKEQASLREVSSRADIDSRSFTNEYHWGDFRGNPVELMKKYFDAHVYLSNFGCRAFHLRLPLALADLDAIRLYEVKHVLEARATASHLVLSFFSEEEPGRNYDDFDSDPSAVLGRLLPVRGMLAEGDLRALYLVWLLAIQNEVIKDDALEPPVPAGLGQLEGVLEDLVDFLWLDPALVEIAAQGSSRQEDRVSAPSTQEWLAKLSVEDKDRWLVRMLGGDEQAAALELRIAFASSRKLNRRQEEKPRRTAGELKTAAEKLADEWHEAEVREAAAEKAAREKKAAEERRQHLRSLEGSEAELWNRVIMLTATSVQSQYDEALRTLIDLRDLADQAGQIMAFSEKLKDLRYLRRTRSSFLTRLNKAGLK